jgi:hypothetical protein
VRLIPEKSDYDAAAEAIRAEFGISPTTIRMQLRHRLSVIWAVHERAQVGMLVKLYEAVRAEMEDAA